MSNKRDLSLAVRPEEEVISKEDWDLEGLVGATEKQLLHPHFDIMWKYLKEHFRPKSNTAVMMLCSNKKPYSENAITKRFLIEARKQSADFFILSNPWVIPIEYDRHYPYLYYDWPEDEETAEIKLLYTRILREKIVEWFNHFTIYRKLISVVRIGETHDAFMQANLPQRNKIDILSEEHMKEIEREYLPVFKGSRGLMKTRLLSLKPVWKWYLEALGGGAVDIRSFL
jgi:hypothetical protein